MDLNKIIDKKLSSVSVETDEICEVGDLNLLDINEFTWGINEMPKWLGLFQKRDLVVLAGYPSCGKTEFTFFLAKNNARYGVKTLYISLELNPEDMITRLARKRVGISKYDWQMRNITDQQLEKMNSEYNKIRYLDNLKILSFEYTPSIEQLEKTIKKHKKEGFDLVFIDNLGKISGDSNENTRFTEITNRLQTLKNNEDVCIFLLHHLSKPQNKMLQYNPGGVSGIRGSQKIIDNATLVFELFRNLDPDLNELEKSEVQLILYKDTMDGATGTIELRFDRGNYILNKKLNA